MTTPNDTDSASRVLAHERSREWIAAGSLQATLCSIAAKHCSASLCQTVERTAVKLFLLVGQADGEPKASTRASLYRQIRALATNVSSLLEVMASRTKVPAADRVRMEGELRLIAERVFTEIGADIEEAERLRDGVPAVSPADEERKAASTTSAPAYGGEATSMNAEPVSADGDAVVATTAGELADDDDVARAPNGHHNGSPTSARKPPPGRKH